MVAALENATADAKAYNRFPVETLCNEVYPHTGDFK